jgi:large subunit ribosomal protein L24
MRVLTDKQRVVVQGLKMVKKHLRKSRENPQGKVVDREGSIHLSNVMRADLYDARQARRGVPPAGA